MANEFSAAVNEAIEAALDAGHAVAADVASEIVSAHKRLYVQEGRRLAWQALLREIKERLRALEVDQAQTALPGFEFPGAIAVRNEAGDIYYVRSDKAVWQEILAGKAERIQNIVAAQAKYDAYERMVVFLEPLMANSPSITMAGAIRLWKQQNGG
jgi:hypothetical protein